MMLNDGLGVFRRFLVRVYSSAEWLGETMIRLFRFLGYAWLAVGGLIMLASFALLWRVDGLSAALEVVRPTQPANFISTAVLVVPGVGLLLLADHLKHRARNRQQSAERLAPRSSASPPK